MNTSHKTAITRNKLSRPMQYLKDNELIVGESLDYGCGKGYDAVTLGMERYDPFYQNGGMVGFYDTITCNYVLNVLTMEERYQVLTRIKALLADDGIAYVTIRRDLPKEGKWGKGCYQSYVTLDYPIVKEVSGSYCMYKVVK